MKRIGIGIQRLQHNIVDLFPGIPSDPDRWSLHGGGTYTHTHPHTHKHTHTHTHTRKQQIQNQMGWYLRNKDLLKVSMDCYG